MSLAMAMTLAMMEIFFQTFIIPLKPWSGEEKTGLGPSVLCLEPNCDRILEQIRGCPWTRLPDYICDGLAGDYYLSCSSTHDEGCWLGGKVGGGQDTEVSVWCVWGSEMLGSGAGKEAGGGESDPAGNYLAR